MKKISLKLFFSIFGISCFLNASSFLQAMEPGAADSRESPELLRKTRSGPQLKRKYDAAASLIVSSQGVTMEEIDNIAELYRYMHSEDFGSAKVAVEKPNEFRKAARVIYHSINKIFGSELAKSKLKELYKQLKKVVQETRPESLTRSKQCRQKAARVINAFDDFTSPLLPLLEQEIAKSRVSITEMKSLAKRKPSLSDLLVMEPTQTPPGTLQSQQTDPDATQSMGTQDTWVLP